MGRRRDRPFTLPLPAVARGLRGQARRARPPFLRRERLAHGDARRRVDASLLPPRPCPKGSTAVAMFVPEGAPSRGGAEARPARRPRIGVVAAALAVPRGSRSPRAEHGVDVPNILGGRHGARLARHRGPGRRDARQLAPQETQRDRERALHASAVSRSGPRAERARHASVGLRRREPHVRLRPAALGDSTHFRRVGPRRARQARSRRTTVRAVERHRRSARAARRGARPTRLRAPRLPVTEPHGRRPGRAARGSCGSTSRTRSSGLASTTSSRS